MPTVRQMYNKLIELEKLDKSEGAYPIMFNSAWAQIEFILYCRWRKFLKRLKIWKS